MNDNSFHRSAGAVILALLVVIGLPLPGEGQEFSVCDPGLLLPASLAGPRSSGRVLRDSDANCQVSTSDLPLGDVPVRLLDAAGQAVAATATMDDGRYFFDASALPPGGTRAGHSYLIAPALPAL